MKHKKWSISLLSITALTLIIFSLVMYISDPLLKYGPEKDLFTYYEYTDTYGNPGIAKQYSYDSVLIGTSMIQNTVTDEFDQAFNCNVAKLPYSGGTAYNMSTILNICFKSGNDIDRVFWGLDESHLRGTPTEPRHPLPDYLYKDGHKKDLSYLLNMDIFYHYTLNNILETLKGNEQTLMPKYEQFTGNFDKESMLKTYERQPINASITTFDDIKPNVDANLQLNILPFIESNPDTEFIFFMVPYSILYWDKEIRDGTFDSALDAVEYSISTLLEYDNVTFYFYQNETEIITNLDNYKDYTHYSPEINSFMIQSMKNDYGKITKDNLHSTIDQMRNDIKNYDFEALFS